jgi:hypothetical protein
MRYEFIRDSDLSMRREDDSYVGPIAVPRAKRSDIDSAIYRIAMPAVGRRRDVRARPLRKPGNIHFSIETRRVSFV